MPAATTATALTEAQVRSFHEQGVLGPFRLWDEDETPVMRALLESVYLNDESVHPSNNRHLDSPEVVDLVRRPQLMDRARSVLGDNILLWRIGCFLKAAGGLAIPWHQDWNYWPIEPAMVLSAWLAVDDVDEENACVQFIPGSHRQLLPHVPVTGMQFQQGADPAQVDASQAVPMILKAGEFVLFNERCLHHSAPNRSDRRRFGLAIRMLPPQVRIMRYDSEHHGVVPLSGTDPLGFNRQVVPGRSG
ncbi:MAG: phytanoyl-CoA dioxygenase family protein [Planctomycetota bacterium]